ncbi:stage II sporulation protein E [Defluviitalea saccharophila]|uniref:Stage II sporulation protein E n=1 Tax=Defluviitalea saccharophila TaxID=879970 RepID=A0ABZ2Y1N6_9FIRM|nr:stage II sporulation protein E [Candidatus Epulonipiscium sp.]
MERVEYRTFKKTDIPKVKKTIHWKEIFLGTTYKDLFIDLLGFMISRVILFTNLLPLSIAYFAAGLHTKANRMWLLLFSAAGVLSVRDSTLSSKYIGAFILMIMLQHFMETKGYTPTKIVQAVMAMIACFVMGMVTAGIHGFAGYYLIVAILESIFVFTAAYIYGSAISCMRGPLKRTILSNEEIISLILIFGTAIAGIIDFSISGIYFREVVSILLVLLFGFIGGPSIGGTIGIVIGTILTLIGVMPAVSIGILGISGMIAGLFKEIGRVGSGIGFLLGQVIISFYFEGTAITYDFLKPILAAIILFLSLPAGIITLIKQFINYEPNLGQEVYYKRIRDITAQQLEAFSNAFLKLSKTFSNISKKKTSLNQRDVSMLIEDVASRVCQDCGLCSHCWESDFYNTYQTVFSILSAAERKSRIDVNDIPQDFIEKCLKVDVFVDTTNRMFELYKLNLLWHNRIVESRELVSEQLRGVSSIIGNLAVEVYGQVYFKEELEQAIKVELDRENIVVSDVMVVSNRQNKYEVVIEHSPCRGKRICTKNIVPVVSQILGRKMKLAGSGCAGLNGKENCKLKLIEEEKYRIMTGVAKESKDSSSISGDTYSFMEIKNGQYLLALSDGMGSGNKASEESGAAIELLEEFMESGFDKDLAIKMINSVLVLKSNEEFFSTLDMTIIDLYTGVAEFVKIGAASAFLKRGDTVEIIGSSSLPVGMLNNVDIDMTKKKLKDGDIIIMVTDGVLDSKKDIIEKEKWFSEVLKGLDITQPEYIAEYLLNIAKENSEKEIEDDMTVLVAKVWEKYS